MIQSSAKLRIERIPLSQLRVTETGKPWTCVIEKFNTYLNLLQEHPDLDVDPSIVRPSAEHPGMFDIQNGKHRYCSSIMAGRADMLCIVEELA